MTIDGYLKEITGDASLSPTQKTVCLKTLSVVLTNLIDPTKGSSSDSATGLKYRTLKLDNPKLGARLFCSGTVRRLLLDPTLVGMVARSAANNNNTTTNDDDNLLVMEEAPSRAIADKIGLTVLPAVSTAHKAVAARATQPTTSTTQTATATATPVVPEKLSEKQKARRLLEEKRRREREQDKAHRRETRAKIAADKLVRKTDENWKPSVSAAADKTGTGLLTFRDRHGE